MQELMKEPEALKKWFMDKRAAFDAKPFDK